MNDDDPSRPHEADGPIWNTPPPPRDVSSSSDGSYASHGSHGSIDDEAADLAAMGVITVGDLLSTTARAVAANFLPFTGIVLLVTLPGFVMSVAVDEWTFAEARSADVYELRQIEAISGILRIGTRLVQIVLGFLAQAALMFGTVEFLAGRTAGFGRSLSGGFASAGTVIALAFLNSLAIGAGLLACIIPGFIVTCILFASVPAAVVERTGPIAAMQRSAELTQGHRATIFLALLVIGLAYLASACVLGIGLAATGAVTDPGLLETSASARWLAYLLDLGLSVPLAIAQATLAGVFYARVRGVRDGVDADAIARAFE